MYLSKLMAEIGQTLLYLGILLTWISFIFHWKQKSIEKKNVLLILFSSASFFMWASYAILLKAFIDNDYSYIIVHNFSDNSMTQTERIMAAWANRQGVMILWAALMNTITISVILYLRNEISHPIVFRSITILLFITAIIATFAASPRNPTAFEIDNSVVFNNGIGLPPSLLSFWQQLHPPIAFLAYSSFIFPYAAGLSILSKKTDEIKIPERVVWLTDFYMLLGWGLTSIYIVAGSIWGYEENWAGFWAWDPVEIAALVMWFASTLYFHAKSQVSSDHPLMAFMAALGWLSVTFAAFIVRSGLLEGLHTYSKSLENQIMSIVFGLLLLGTAIGLLFAIKRSNSKIFPEELYNWTNHKNKPTLATFWTLASLIIVNVVGLFVQLVNAIITDQTDIPYNYYIVLNGVLLITLSILFILCEFKSKDWTSSAKQNVLGISALISLIALFSILGHNPVIYIVNVVLFTILLSLMVNSFRTVFKYKNFKKFSIQLIHITILLMIISYSSVDQSTTRVNENLVPGEVTMIEEFDFSINATRFIPGGSARHQVRLDVFEGSKIIGTVILTQGEHGDDKTIAKEYWERGGWISLPTKDYFFRFQDDSEYPWLNQFVSDRTVAIEIYEKPLASLFRVTFGLLVVVTVLGLTARIVKRPRNSI